VGGGGEKGPLPSPPPRLARTPLAPARADGTRRNRPPRDTFQAARPLERVHGGRPNGRVICTPRAPSLRPSPTRCTRTAAAGPGRRLPRIPPHPSLTPRPQPLPVRRRAWPAVRDRKESRHWEVLGEGGAGLKGTTTFFQPGEKTRGGVVAGGDRELPRN